MVDAIKILLIELDRDLGGSIYSTIALAQQLIDNGYDVRMIIPKKNSWEYLLVNKNISYYKLNAWPAVKKISDPMTIKKRIIKIFKDRVNDASEQKISKIIKKENINIVHIATLNYECGAKSAQKCNQKLIWHIREFLEEDHGTEWIVPEKSIKLLGNADKIICISDSILNKYSKILPSQKMVRIYNGIDAREYEYYGEKFINHIIQFSAFGRIVEGKGYDELIRAVKLANIPNMILHIYGDGEYKEQLQKKIKENNLERKVILEGITKYVPEKMRQTDVVCVCSRLEAFGRTTVEGMMNGCLVIGADSGGTAELIKHNITGLLYKQGNASNLAERMKEVASNPKQYREIAMRGQKEAIEQYSIEKNTMNIMSVYNEVLKNEAASKS